MDAAAPQLEANGIKLIDSKIRGVTFGFKDKSVLIFAGKNGVLSVDEDMLVPLFNELWDCVEHMREGCND